MEYIANIIGFIGVFLVVFAYFLMQLKTLSSKSVIFNFMNLFGAVFILFSLFYSWNLPSAVIQIIWILASIIGIIKRKRNE